MVTDSSNVLIFLYIICFVLRFPVDYNNISLYSNSQICKEILQYFVSLVALVMMLWKKTTLMQPVKKYLAGNTKIPETVKLSDNRPPILRFCHFVSKAACSQAVKKPVFCYFIKLHVLLILKRHPYLH